MAAVFQFVRVVGLCAVVAAGMGASASAQTTVGAVTVVGKKALDKDAIKTVIAPFVKQHAARDRKSGLLVRAPPSGVCPLTLGLSPAFNAFVTARIVAVASEAGSAVQTVGQCQPNVEVVFTEDPQDLVNALGKKTGGAILGFHFVGERRALIQVSRPIQAWYMTGTVSSTPAYAARVIDVSGLQPDIPPLTAGPAAAVIDDAYSPNPYTGTGSRFAPDHSSQIVNVLIVADLGKLDGWQIGPISDYVAMLSLSQPRSLDACSPLPSILDMLASECHGRLAPQALTESDAAFLKALYTADISTSGDRASYRIEHGMAKDIAAAKP